jgi:histidinol-phosphate aminotransferase
MIEARRAVQRLKKYRPPLEGRGGKLRLDFNENTVGCAPEVVRSLRRTLDSEWLSRYPEYEEGRKKLARFFRVGLDEILLANGTDDAIKLICDALVDPNDALVVPAPTFPIYEFFNSVAGGRTVRVRYDENFNLPIEKMIATVRKEKARWVALANPNNPTGTVISKRDLKALLRAAPSTAVLVDEAYYDFSGQTVLPWIRKYPNLIVTRTFSKAFGLAAVRLGCIFANSRLAEAVHRAQNPFAVNMLAIAAALEAIKHRRHVRRYAQEVIRNRGELRRYLKSIGAPYVPSSANFVLTRLGSRAPEIARRLRKEDLLVRDWSYDPHLKGYLRFTVGSRAQMRKLIRGLNRCLPMIESGARGGAWKDFVAYSSTGWFA